ncbi:uncharacterized protein LOC143597120 [Bidens hawaiensis]|uniref:uncharacterized protein LOC143597120 n=1 Tax=Bidens hawaiensis TaxID=980011 RepID=UPI00404A1FD8
MDFPNSSGIWDQLIEETHVIHQTHQQALEEGEEVMSATRVIANKIASGSTSSSPQRRRSYILRDRLDANDRLMKDYFNDRTRFDDVTFQHRFWMSKRLFFRIARNLERKYTYFQQKPDARGYLGFTAIQKYTSALRILAHGNTTDINDEYLKMAEKTTRDSLEIFCTAKV